MLLCNIFAADSLTCTTIMSTNDEYDKLTKEEREARDKADAEREAAEQAGMARSTSLALDQIIDNVS